MHDTQLPARAPFDPGTDRATWLERLRGSLSASMRDIVIGFAMGAAGLYLHPLHPFIEAEGHDDSDPPPRPRSRDARARRRMPRSNAITGPWIAAILTIPSTLWARVDRVRARRRARAELLALDDRTLNDIGLSRSEIDLIFHHPNRRRL